MDDFEEWYAEAKAKYGNDHGGLWAALDKRHDQYERRIFGRIVGALAVILVAEIALGVWLLMGD